MVRRRRKRSGRRSGVVGVGVCIFDKCGGFEVAGETARERLRFFSLARFERLWFLGLVVEEGRTWSFYVDYYIVKGFRWHPSWRLWKSQWAFFVLAERVFERLNGLLLFKVLVWVVSCFDPVLGLSRCGLFTRSGKESMGKLEIEARASGNVG